MKKILYIALISLSVNAFAQDDDVLTTNEGSSAGSNLSKSGKQLTPVAGDMGISFNAAPFFQWGGNIFGFTGNNNALNGVTSPDNFHIMARYFLADDMAVRVRLGVDNNMAITREYHNDDLTPMEPNAYVNNRIVEADAATSLIVGVEMRRGEGRIQGYYGGELGLSRFSYKMFEEYGNDATIDNQNPTGWGQLVADYRPTSWAIGLGGVIGAEYFFAPKMSLGAEFGLGFFYNTMTAGEFQSQEWSDGGLELRVEPYDHNKTIGLNTNTTSTINLNIFF